MPAYDILAAGSYCLDLIFTGMPGFLELGKQVEADGFEMISGEAFNSVVAMHRLGIRVGWATDFGSDPFSRFALEQVRAEGLDESLFIHHKQPLRRITVAASYPKDRAFLAYYDPDPAVPAVVKALAKTSARACYLPGLYYGPLLEAGLALLRVRRMDLVMDGNSGEKANLSSPNVRKAVQSAAVFLPNADEARRLTQQDNLQKALHCLGKLCSVVVIKDGPNGSWAIREGKIDYAPAIPVEAVDTTGAGDCFNAGFLKAWLDERSLPECLRWGNIVGGLSTTALGGTKRVIRVDEVKEWLSDKGSTRSRG
jgi:sugar/nucleoside kinase (ribokinase family)